MMVRAFSGYPSARHVRRVFQLTIATALVIAVLTLTTGVGVTASPQLSPDGDESLALRAWSVGDAENEALENPARLNSADRADSIGTLSDTSAALSFDSAAMRDIELNENPPMFPSPQGSGSAASLEFDSAAMRDIELNANPPMVRSSQDSSDAAVVFEIMEQFPGAFTNPSAPATAQDSSDAAAEFEIMEQYPGAFTNPNTSETARQAGDYRFFEENYFLPDAGIAIDPDVAVRADFRFIEENTWLPGGSAVTHATDPDSIGYVA